MSAKLVDPHVYDLAAFWLSDDTVTHKAAHERRVMSLAQSIQSAIEDWWFDETRIAEEADARADELRSLRGLTDDEKARI